MVESERDDLVDGHNLGVAQRGREQCAEALKALVPTTTGCTPVRHQHRQIRLRRQLAVRPGALSALRAHRSRHQSERGRTLRQDLHLNTGFRARGAIQRGRGHQFATGRPFGRQPNFYHRRGLHTEILRGDARRSGDGILSKEGRLGPRALLGCRCGERRLQLLHEATEYSPEQRSLERGPLAAQDRIGSILAQGRGLRREQGLEICSQPALFFDGGGRTPTGQDRTLRDRGFQRTAACLWLAEKMPQRGMAQPIGMRITSQDGG